MTGNELPVPSTATPKERDIIRLLDINQTLVHVHQITNLVATNLTRFARARRPAEAESILDIARAETRRIFDENLDSLVPRFMSVYDRYFTHDEILQMLAFYESPIGRKTLRVTPEVLPACIETMQNWANGFIPTLRERLHERDPTLATQEPGS